MTDRYARYRALKIVRHPDGIVEVVMAAAPGSSLPTDRKSVV